MLSQTLIKSEEKEIDYEKEWKKTIMYKIFRKKTPSEAWKEQLKRIKYRINR